MLLPADRNTYSRRSIEDHFASRQRRCLSLTSPLTNEEIRSPELARLIPNLAVLRLVVTHKKQRAGLIDVFQL